MPHDAQPCNQAYHYCTVGFLIGICFGVLGNHSLEMFTQMFETYKILSEKKKVFLLSAKLEIELTSKHYL